MNRKTNGQQSIGSSRVGVVVLGMHRSGTSTLTRALNMLGCHLPDNLIGAHQSNEAGHWEPCAIVALNDRILESQGSDWADWDEVSQGWYQSPLYPDFVSQGQAVLREEFGDSRLFALKDPRICRLVPLWLDILKREKVRPVFVLPIRNPIEVAESLARRDGLHQSSSLLMWLRYSLDSEYATRGQIRAVTTYEELLQTPEALMIRLQQELKITWPKSGTATMGELRGFVTQDLRHHRRPDNSVLDNPTLSEWVKSTYAIMLRWAANQHHDDDFSQLDRIRHEFDNCLPAFAGLAHALRAEQLRVTQLAREADELRRQVADAVQSVEDEHAATGAAGQATGAHIVALQDEVERLRAGVVWNDQARNALESELHKTESELANVLQSLAASAAMEDQLAALQAKLHGLEADAQIASAELQGMAEATARLEECREQVARLEDEVVAACTALAQHGETEGVLEARLRQAELDLSVTSAALCEASKAQTLVSELEDKLRELEVHRDLAMTAAARAAELERELAESRNHAQQLDGEIAGISSTLIERESEVAITKSALQQRCEEVDQTLAELNSAQMRVSNLEGRIEQALDEIERWRIKAHDADNWVFQLSAERATLEQKLVFADKSLAERTTAAARAEAAAQSNEERSRWLEADVRAAREAEAKLAAQVEQNASDLNELNEKLLAAEAASHEVKRALDTRFKEIAQLSAMLTEQTDKSGSQVADHQARLQAELAEAIATRNSLQRERDERFSEIAAMARLLQSSQRVEQHANWLREVNIALLEKPSWWRLMPRKWVRRKELDRLNNMGIFNASNYLHNNPDVADAKFDPLDHFIIHGFAEGRVL